MKIFNIFRKKKKIVISNAEEENLQREEEFLKRLQRVTALRDEVYKAIETNIKKRLEAPAKKSQKGKDYIDEDDVRFLGGKANLPGR